MNKDDDSEGKTIPYISDLDKVLKDRSEALNKNKQLFDSFSSVLYRFIKNSEELNEKAKQSNINYFNELNSYLDTCRSSKNALNYLYSEKRKYQSKLIQANIKKDGYDRKCIENTITIILLPLILHWEKQLELENKLSHSKMTSQNLAPQSPDKNNSETILINEKEKLSDLIHLEVSKTPIGFKQIDCGATKEQIERYFSILALATNRSNGNSYLSQSEVDELIRNNFSIFGCIPTGKYFDINLNKRQKATLRYFVFQFYQKFETRFIGTKMQYVNFLRWNFDLFKNDKPDILNSNMNESKKPAHIIPIDKYF